MRPASRRFFSIHDIIDLPNYPEIRERFRLDSDMAAKIDHHNRYDHGQEPLPCPCHPKPRSLSKNPAYVVLSPLWQRALEKTFHIKLPTSLYLST